MPKKKKKKKKGFLVNYFYSPNSRHLKREAYTAFLTDIENPETSDDTSFLGGNGKQTTKTEVTFVQLDVRELEIPYDVMIGRPDIRQHQLLRFNPEQSLTGLNIQTE